MLNALSGNIKIETVFSARWGEQTAYAAPRPCAALSFRLSGEAMFSHGDKKWQVHKNDILFVPAGYDYTIHSQKAEELLIVHLSIENAPTTDICVFTPLNPDVFAKLLEEMHECQKSKTVGYLYKVQALFYKLLEQIEIQQSKKAATPKKLKLQEALNFMHEHFSSPDASVETAAKHANVSTVFLRKLFHASLHVTPLCYLTTLRIEHAENLLKTGYYSVEETATLCGFNDAKYFSAVYKKTKGVSPSAHHKQALKRKKTLS